MQGRNTFGTYAHLIKQSFVFSLCSSVFIESFPRMNYFTKNEQFTQCQMYNGKYFLVWTFTLHITIQPLAETNKNRQCIMKLIQIFLIGKLIFYVNRYNIYSKLVNSTSYMFDFRIMQQ